MRLFLTSLFLWALPLAVWAQHPMEGRWVGTITHGGIDSDRAHEFEMILDVDARGYLNGYAVVHLSPVRRIETRVQGRLHQDRSLSMLDLQLEAEVDSTLLPEFYRKYQLIYERSIWESTLNGFWQEVMPHYFSDRRKRGRISLKRAKPSKA